jgi:hypothetical protein
MHLFPTPILAGFFLSQCDAFIRPLRTLLFRDSVADNTPGLSLNIFDCDHRASARCLSTVINPAFDNSSSARALSNLSRPNSLSCLFDSQTVQFFSIPASCQMTIATWRAFPFCLAAIASHLIGTGPFRNNSPYLMLWQSIGFYQIMRYLWVDTLKILKSQFTTITMSLT